MDLGLAWQRIGDRTAIQGNLDPVALLAPWEAVEQRARAILDRTMVNPGHIFNLGHGVLPTTPPDTVRRLVEFVHDYSAAHRE